MGAGAWPMAANSLVVLDIETVPDAVNHSGTGLLDQYARVLWGLTIQRDVERKLGAAVPAWQRH